ncbi:MAG: RluA family pseudouridine synthase [Lachnospiraceae bacterium]
MKILTVNANEAGQRLDKLLAKYLNLAGKGFLYKMLRKKNITLNGKKCDGSEKLVEGDEIKLFLSDETIEKFSDLKIQKVKKTKLDIIYEDEHILLVNKPVGMLSQKAKDSDESLVEYIIDYLLDQGSLTKEDLKTFRPSVCNRLDRNTSGLVAAGKSLAGLQILSAVFKDRTIHKYYQCLVAGSMKQSQTIRGFLLKEEATNRVTIHKTQAEGSLPIATEYEPLWSQTACSLVKVTLITGRTHQIRAHLASIGHPILGDPKYGNARINRQMEQAYGLKNQLLHSWKLVMPENLPAPLDHLSGASFYAPLPSMFSKVEAGEHQKQERG